MYIRLLIQTNPIEVILNALPSIWMGVSGSKHLFTTALNQLLEASFLVSVMWI